MVNVIYINWTDKMSGGEISIMNYAKHLDRNVFRPIFLFPKKGKASQKASNENLDVKFMKMNFLSLKKPWKFVSSLLRLIKLLKKEKIDIIHNTSFYSNSLSAVAGKILGIPVISHGQSYLTPKEIRRNLLALSDKIIVCSKSVKKSLLPYVRSRKISVMYHAVDIPQSKKNSYSKKKTYFLNKDLGISKKCKKCKLIGHVGLIEPRKRQEDLIRAAKLVKNKDARFLIIGNSQFNTEKYEKHMRSLVKSLGLENKVLFLGFRDDMKKIMNELDILVLPSINEPFALVMLEGMALGKPFIGARSGGTPELIEHGKNGFLIKPKDYVSLAKIIDNLLKDQKKAKNIGVKGRISVIERCEINGFAKRLSNVYISMLKR